MQASPPVADNRTFHSIESALLVLSVEVHFVKGESFTVYRRNAAGAESAAGTEAQTPSVAGPLRLDEFVADPR